AILASMTTLVGCSTKEKIVFLPITPVAPIVRPVPQPEPYVPDQQSVHRRHTLPPKEEGTKPPVPVTHDTPSTTESAPAPKT
ncbi:MAG: hypothetical protein ACI4U2_06345, partial [Christensenellaceae bacterium]